MADKIPQPTNVLIERLQRVAKWFDDFDCDALVVKNSMRARANTCWQAAGRLEELDKLQRESVAGQKVSR